MSPCLRPASGDWIPERYVVGHAGKAAGAEENRVAVADRLQSVLGHHAAVLQAVLAAPGKLFAREFDAELAPCGFEHAQAFGHDFLADPVAGDDGDLVGLRQSFPFRTRPCGRP
jgi:hypothetical protein